MVCTLKDCGKPSGRAVNTHFNVQTQQLVDFLKMEKLKTEQLQHDRWILGRSLVIAMGCASFPHPSMCCLQLQPACLSLRGSEPGECLSPSPEPSTFLTWNLPARESIYPCSSYLSWKSPSNSLPLPSKETQHTAPSKFSVVPTPTSTSGCNDSLLIILTERGFYLLKHKNVTSILSKFLLPFGRH